MKILIDINEEELKRAILCVLTNDNSLPTLVAVKDLLLNILKQLVTSNSISITKVKENAQ